MAHIHSVYDTDEHFSINADTRRITYLGATKPVLVQGDHLSQRFTFEMPRYIDAHDMLDCTKIEINYQNGNSTGTYHPNDVAVSPADNNIIIFSWLISNNATKNNCDLQFSITASCLSDIGEIEYQWSTATASLVTVARKIANGSIYEEGDNTTASNILNSATLDNMVLM